MRKAWHKKMFKKSTLPSMSVSHFNETSINVMKSSQFVKSNRKHYQLSWVFFLCKFRLLSLVQPFYIVFDQRLNYPNNCWELSWEKVCVTEGGVLSLSYTDKAYWYTVDYCGHAMLAGHSWSKSTVYWCALYHNQPTTEVLLLSPLPPASKLNGV